MIVNANESVYPTLRIITDRTFFLHNILNPFCSSTLTRSLNFTFFPQQPGSTQPLNVPGCINAHGFGSRHARQPGHGHDVAREDHDEFGAQGRADFSDGNGKSAGGSFFCRGRLKSCMAFWPCTRGTVRIRWLPIPQIVAARAWETQRPRLRRSAG